MAGSGRIHRRRSIMSRVQACAWNKEYSMRRVLPLKIALASLAIAACVTINVYFPAAAADKAADQVINDITGGGAKGGTATPPQSNFVPAQSADEPNFLVYGLGNALNAL